MTAILDYQITWVKLPDDFILPDDHFDNINQPLWAAALSDGLDVPSNALITTNYGLCAMINEKFAVKAPDWAYIAKITVPREQIIRSYTPNLQGEKPLIVMEFLSETEGGEYSIKQTYPPENGFFMSKFYKFKTMLYLTLIKIYSKFINSIKGVITNYKNPMKMTVI